MTDQIRCHACGASLTSAVHQCVPEFVCRPWANLATASAEREALPDALKLYVVALWFDGYDDQRGYTGDREVQRDLRSIAATLGAAPVTDSA